jgi:hypothetical protein
VGRLILYPVLEALVKAIGLAKISISNFAVSKLANLTLSDLTVSSGESHFLIPSLRKHTAPSTTHHTHNAGNTQETRAAPKIRHAKGQG